MFVGTDRHHQRARDDPLIPLFMRDEVRAVLEPAVAYRFESGGHFPYIVRPKLYTVITGRAARSRASRLDPLGQCRGARAMIVLSHEDVAALLPPATAIEVVARAMARHLARRG